MYLPFDDAHKPKHITEYLEMRRLIEERIRRGDRRQPAEIYEEFARLTGDITTEDSQL